MSSGLNLLEERAAPKTAGFQGSPPFRDFRAFRGSQIKPLFRGSIRIRYRPGFRVHLVTEFFDVLTSLQKLVLLGGQFFVE